MPTQAAQRVGPEVNFVNTLLGGEPFRRALNALNSNIECDDSFAVSFADPQREFYKFHSLLGSVGELSGDKL